MSSFLLKMLALFFMLIDHIAVFIPDIPIFFRWIGRISAPIFIFCTAWGFTYSTNKRNYLIRLYIASVIMAIIQFYLKIDNNFFRTLFSLGLILVLLQMFKSKHPKFKKYLTIYMSWQIISIILCIVMFNTENT